MNLRRIVAHADDCTPASYLPDSAETLKRLRQLETLERILNTVNGEADTNAAICMVLDDVLQMFGASTGAIMLAERDFGSLYFHCCRGFSNDQTENIRINPGEGLIGSVYATGIPLISGNVSESAQILNNNCGLANRMRSILCVPIRRFDDKMGIVFISSAETGAFTSDDAAMMNSVSNCLATVVIKTVINKKISKGMARYQALLRHSLNAQEEERHRIARELHDETSQALTSLAFRLQALMQMAEAKEVESARFKEGLKKAHSYAVQAGNEVVKLMMNLRPTILDDMGMPAAIYRYAKDTLEAKGINVDIEFNGRERRLPSEIEIACFRVAQGLISNILKHSDAKNVSIKVACSESRAVLHITDDGIGFNVKEVTEVEPNGRGAGLLTIKERLRLIGGTWQIESEPGQGTRTTIIVPIVNKLEDIANEWE